MATSPNPSASTDEYRKWTKAVRGKINFVGVHKKEVLLMAAAIDTLADSLDAARAELHKCDEKGGHFFEDAGEDDDGE